jgi:hypothetical protein
LYDKIVEPSERLSDTTKKVMLETAVHPIEMLHAVKVQADQLTGSLIERALDANKDLYIT